MEVEKQNIYNQFRRLIIDSCAFDRFPSHDCQRFHHDYLKFFFGVVQIEIDYATKSIELLSPKPISTEPLTTYNVNSSVTATVSYEDLEATLLGCMEYDEFSIGFYRYLLSEYGHNISEHDPSNKRSA